MKCREKWDGMEGGKEMGRGVQVGGKDVQRRRYSQEEREEESE